MLRSGKITLRSPARCAADAFGPWWIPGTSPRFRISAAAGQSVRTRGRAGETGAPVPPQGRRSGPKTQFQHGGVPVIEEKDKDFSVYEVPMSLVEHGMDELIVRKLGEGATEADLLDAYPRLSREDIRAALAYAAESLAHETVVLQVA